MPKNEATLHFAEYLENYHCIFTRFFAHIKASVYSVHGRFSNFILYSGAIWRIVAISITAGLYSIDLHCAIANAERQRVRLKVKFLASLTSRSDVMCYYLLVRPLYTCSICPPLHCTTFSRRRHHSLILLSRNACDSTVVATR